LIRELGAEDLEILVCDRLEKMGFICIRTGPIHKPDGGIDIIACPQEAVQFPYLLAVQVKSHRSGQPTPVKVVRDFVGAIQSQPFRAGVAGSLQGYVQLPFLLELKYSNHLRETLDSGRRTLAGFSARLTASHREYPKVAPLNRRTFWSPLLSLIALLTRVAAVNACGAGYHP
jgi:hypothetical protein